MIGTNRYPSPQITRMHTEFSNDDTLSGNSIHKLTTGQEVKMYSVTSGAGKFDFSWGAFKLDPLMSDTVAFDVTLWTLDDGITKYVVNINKGEGWSPANLFIAKRDGIYFFSASVGTTNFRQVSFTRNDNPHCVFMLLHEFKHGADIASRSCLLHLEAQDEVSLKLNPPFTNIVYIFGITSFRGFFYNPIHKTAAIAWSVHYDSDVDIVAKENLKFDNVLIDTHKSWNISSGIFVVPCSGRYLLEIVGTTNNYTGSTRTVIDMCVSINRISTLFPLKFTSNFSHVTRSRSAIVSLKKDDRLSVESLYSGKRMSGGNHQGVSFQGLLLYPD